jgi:hypothetical protein
MSFVQHLLSVLVGLQYSKVPHPGGASPYDLTTRQPCSVVKQSLNIPLLPLPVIMHHWQCQSRSANAGVACLPPRCSRRRRLTASTVGSSGERQDTSAAAPSLPSCAIRITLKLKRRLCFTTSFTCEIFGFLQICCSAKVRQLQCDQSPATRV